MREKKKIEVPERLNRKDGQETIMNSVERTSGSGEETNPEEEIKTHRERKIV